MARKGLSEKVTSEQITEEEAAISVINVHVIDQNKLCNKPQNFVVYDSHLLSLMSLVVGLGVSSAHFSSM